MKTVVKTNIWNISAGDRITLTNKVGHKVDMLVTRVEEKSWYGGENGANGRNSYGTLQSLAKYADFKIIKTK